MDNFIAHILVVDDDDGIRSLVKKYLNYKNILEDYFILQKEWDLKFHIANMKLIWHQKK